MDRDVVGRAQAGDELAFAVLADRIADRLYAMAFHILRDADLADDAAQQAMIEIWRHLPGLKDPDRLLAWAYRIVARTAYAEARRTRSWRVAAAPLAPAVPDIGAHTDAVADRDQLARGFQRLSLDHRVVVVLKHFGSLSDAEISRALDIPEGTVRSRLHYSMRVLRAALEADARP